MLVYSIIVLVMLNFGVSLGLIGNWFLGIVVVIFC